MITNENKKLAQWAMEFALKNGCQASRVSLLTKADGIPQVTGQDCPSLPHVQVPLSIL